jgi:flagellar motility protein MotE (MotC chaperone)
MDFRLRLMPVAIAATVSLLGVKLGNVWFALEAPVTAAHAEQTPEKPAEKPTKPVAAAPSPNDGAGPAPPSAAKPDAIDPLAISPSEMELLQKLSERRAELDKRAADLSQREVLLQAAEKRIDDKIARLQSLEKDIGGIVDKQSEESEARTRSLVKIYETMKPHDAARIFEQLDMGVLLSVLEHMKERNAAPILAALDPIKARAVTLALAERKDKALKTDTGSQALPEKQASKP